MDTVVFRCSFGGDCAIFSHCNGCSFNELSDVIRSKFMNLRLGPFEIKYILPGADPCVLCNDDDMSFMFIFFRISGIGDIELIVSSPVLPIAEPSIAIPEIDPEFTPDFDDDIQDNSGNKVFLCESWKYYITHIQQRFPGEVSDFRLELGKYCIAIGFEVEFKKNHWSRVTAVCAKADSQDCKWFVHAVLRQSDGSFMIKKLVNEHKCTGHMMGWRSKMVRSKVVASVIADKVQAEPSMSAKEVMKSMKREYRITVPYWNAWYAKEIAWREVHGDDNSLHGVARAD